MLKRYFYCLLILLATTNFAYADDYAELVAYRDSLKQQIDAIDSEIARCEKSMKKWKTATIIGGVGAVASGIGIIAQTQQIKQNDKVLKDMSKDAKEADIAIKFIEEAK